MNHASTPSPHTLSEYASHAQRLWRIVEPSLFAGEPRDRIEGMWIRAGIPLIKIPDGEHTAWLVDLILAGQPYNMDKVNRGDPTATANLRTVLEAAPPHMVGSTDPWVRTFDEVSDCWQVGVNLTGHSVVVMEFYAIGRTWASGWVCGLMPRVLEALA